ncbi:Phosphoserine aminotransferase [Candidatus Kinetoplastibacterium sorsogonicusi]|uniref:Phosphoserine aminotransferase n=1 Tax=Candidatus Kinetoplastidibacterium kentomonadis TaxID=1576550 RepID=A0A3Q8EUA1_9PROT|nr:3-phosphoserine/phosphohydroxythreonine transaminase [Candidatus Kinetoplastibacterium sorsogonicusi]AWD32530.1 Phosphoserine aminotransferase [Candidatus Kinetoplastibacterium sorsogonicusi]
MNKGWNFSAGQSMLPSEVINQISNDVFDFNSSGMSILEINHRSDDFANIIYEAEKNLMHLLDLPDHYEILFMQGGASVANAMIPMNISYNSVANFILSGYWSNKSKNEASKYCQVHIAADSFSNNINNYYFPKIENWKVSNNPSYLHICSNETITGLEFVNWNDYSQKKISFVIDATSNFLSRKFNMNNVGILFAGCQKNIGISGLTVIIINKNLLNRHPLKTCPTVYNFHNMFLKKSIVNTPPIFAIYVAGLIFKWLLKNGGIEKFESNNIKKSEIFYKYLDSTKFYINYVEHKYRSRMNVTFNLVDETKNKKFFDNASDALLYNLKGHRNLGGFRASIYNAMPIDGIHALINFMKDFECRYG